MTEAKAPPGWTRETLPQGFPTLIGPIWSRVDGQRMRHGFVIDDRHVNSMKVLHGGMLMGFTDHALGLQAGHAVGGVRRTTIQFNVQFVAAAALGEFVETDIRVVRRTRGLIFMDGTLRVGERDIAAAQCIFKLHDEPTAR